MRWITGSIRCGSDNQAHDLCWMFLCYFFFPVSLFLSCFVSTSKYIWSVGSIPATPRGPQSPSFSLLASDEQHLPAINQTVLILFLCPLRTTASWFSGVLVTTWSETCCRTSHGFLFCLPGLCTGIQRIFVVSFPFILSLRGTLDHRWAACGSRVWHVFIISKKKKKDGKIYCHMESIERRMGHLQLPSLWRLSWTLTWLSKLGMWKCLTKRWELSDCCFREITNADCN